MQPKQTALILGATKGLGKCIALRCRELGFATIEIGSTAPTYEEQDKISLRYDLSNAYDTLDLGYVLTGKNVDYFFWNAGVLMKGGFSDQKTEDVMRVVDVNFRNALLIAHKVWRSMYDAGSPKYFCVIASTSGCIPREEEAVYVATKFAQVGFARSLGLENKNPNVRVSLFLPGGMQTEFWQKYPHPQYDTFLSANWVAERIIASMQAQQACFMELTLPRA